MPFSVNFQEVSMFINLLPINCIANICGSMITVLLYVANFYILGFYATVHVILEFRSTVIQSCSKESSPWQIFHRICSSPCIHITFRRYRFTKFPYISFIKLLIFYYLGT